MLISTFIVILAYRNISHVNRSCISGWKRGFISHNSLYENIIWMFVVIWGTRKLPYAFQVERNLWMLAFSKEWKNVQLECNWWRRSISHNLKFQLMRKYHIKYFIWDSYPLSVLEDDKLMQETHDFSYPTLLKRYRYQHH